MALRETENNAYANFWGDKQRALWYVMVFSAVVSSEVPSQESLQPEQRKLPVGVLCQMYVKRNRDKLTFS